MDYKAQNPFDDTSAHSTTRNPFEDSIDVSPGPPLPPKKSTVSSSSTRNENLDFDLTPEAIEGKELELKRREEDINRRESAMLSKEKSITNTRKNNWPPIKILCIHPILYHNIKEDIPEDTQRLIKRAYVGWFMTIWCYFYNFFTELSALFASGSVGSFVLSIIFFLFNVPLSLFVYRILYQAARRGKPILYVAYFVLIWVEFVIFAFMGIGLSSWGGGGLFLAIKEFQANQKVVGIFSIICLVFWSLLFLYHFFLVWIPAVRQYRAIGGFRKAKQEAAGIAAQKMKENPDLVLKGAKVASQV